MILSDKQYNCTKKTLNDFEEALKLTRSKSNSKKWLKEIEIAGTEYLISKFQERIKQYEDLLSGKVRFKSRYTLKKLKSILPQIRISKGLSQEELAKKLKIGVKKLWRYEDSQYYGCDSETISRIASALDVQIVDENKSAKSQAKYATIGIGKTETSIKKGEKPVRKRSTLPEEQTEEYVRQMVLTWLIDTVKYASKYVVIEGNYPELGNGIDIGLLNSKNEVDMVIECKSKEVGIKDADTKRQACGNAKKLGSKYVWITDGTNHIYMIHDVKWQKSDFYGLREKIADLKSKLEE